MKTTEYFRDRVLGRPEREHVLILIHRVAQAIEAPLRVEQQANGRTRRWVYCPESDHYMRVIVEADGERVHNAFYDRNFKFEETRK